MTPLDRILELRRASAELDAITHRVKAQVEALYTLHLARSISLPTPDDLDLELDSVTLPDGRVIPFSPAGFMELYSTICETPHAS